MQIGDIIKKDKVFKVDDLNKVIEQNGIKKFRYNEIKRNIY